MQNKIVLLKEKLQKFGTRELLGMISVHFYTFGNNAKDIAEQSDIFNKTDLMSPQKQYAYLAGLLMSTDDLSEGIKNDDPKKYEELEEEIQGITIEYTKTFLNFDHTPEGPDLDIVKRNLVAMEAFTSYFDTEVLRYKEQTEILIRSLYAPFNEELKQLTTLDIDDYLKFYHLVEDSFGESVDQTKVVNQNIQEFLGSFNLTDDIKSQYQRLITGDNGRIGREIKKAMDGLQTISREKIIQSFGELKANKLIELFTLKRQKCDFMYYNNSNPFTQQPLCWLDEGQTFFIVHPNFLMSAIYNFIMSIIENPKNKFAEKFKKSKADIAENLFLEQLKKLFGDTAKYHTSVCEEKGTKEHDILIEYKNYIVIAEVKASKVREPFFNPEKSYTRISDHFNSDSGIGGAYQQAIILKKIIESEDTITLYENKIRAFTISETPKKKVIPIVLTLAQFGGIAVNTSFLLEKDIDQPFPWVCNLHDLENIVQINTYLKKKTDDFIDYLIWRIDNHKAIISSDELDVIQGFYLDKKVKMEKDGNLFFWPTGPSLIDKIYFEKKGIPYYFAPLDNVPRKNIKIGRNDPCSCGSGKKHKKCCGK